MKNGSMILIVDDEPSCREILEALLTEQGYNLAFAGNGAEALAKAKELTPDLILLDVMMPGMDGFEVCRHLRSDSVLAKVPIIMVTVLDDRDSRLRGIEAGADDFVTKPFDQTELLARIRTITQLNRYRQLLLVNRRLQSKIARLSALYDISSTLNSAFDIDSLLESIIQKAKELLKVEDARILLGDRRRGRLYLPIIRTEGEGAGFWPKRSHFPVSSGVSGWVFSQGKPAIVQNVTTDKYLSREIDENIGSAVRSILCVPLRGKEGVLGVLEAVNKRKRKFTEDDQNLLQAMADNIAVSIEKADLYRDLQRAEALLRRQNAELRRAVRQKYRFENIVGKSDKIIDILKKAEQVALTDSTVLIYGETGTGKDLLAQAIHQSSPRSLRDFVPINCGAIPENLLESELFGHEKGAFTSADEQRIGRFEEANGGTLFLDEISDMPLNLQVKLLRVLQENVIQRLGSNQGIPIDVRVIAATHADLAQLVAEGRFRQDLYYRLKVFELELHPLRERREDIPLLINHFIAHYNETLGKQIVEIEDTAHDVLYYYDYPGNVRELQHLIESAMILCKGNTISIDDLPREMQTLMISDKNLTVSEEHIAIPRNNEELKAAKIEAQRKIERLFLTELLSSTHGNVSQAARKAGMNRSWLTQLINKHELDPSQFQRDVS